ncbi:alpha/beta-hydrolase, partial [Aureobasidium namibiae CBS 147.97]
IPSSTTLQWHRCFGEDFYCAKLEVPMNHNLASEADGSDYSIVELAIIMLPGINHTANRNYSVAPLIVNPGGPGGSGVEFIRNLGHAIQEMAGHDRDIVSFDPRGVGYTKPTADCYTFPTSGSSSALGDSDIMRGQFNRLQFALSNEAVGLVNSTESALMQRDSAARAVAQLCKQKDDLDGKRSILRHLNTQNVARDMLYIVDAWDDWLETFKAHTTPQMNDKVMERSKGMLSFLGFSYGTLLGATFATMFPDRIGRMVLDGVVDAASSNIAFAPGTLEDADTVYDLFFKYCAEAGPRKCAIARDGDHAHDVARRVAAALQSLREQSLVGVHAATKTPSIITWSMLKGAIFGSLYSPVTSFPLIAQIYDYLHRGDHNALHASIPQLHSMIRQQSYCLPPTQHSFDLGDAQNSIRCSDQNRLNATIPELLQSFESLSRVSLFADVFMNVGLPCNGWSIPSIDSPLRMTVPDGWKETGQTNTSFPLLFVSNTHDPITPLRAGIRMAQRFYGAGFIEQEGEGHCSIAEVSLCTVSKVRAYFRDGIVPPAPRLKDGQHVREGLWDRCETNERPWQP